MRFGVLAFAVVALCGAGVAQAGEKKGEPLVKTGEAYVVVEIQTLDDSLLKGTKMPGNLTLARYDPVKSDIRGGQLSTDTAVAPKEAVRVTISEKPLAKTKTGRLYLVRLQPDTWVIEGSSGTAFSLGSMSFRIAAGEVLDLGVMKPAVDWLEGEGPKSMMGGIMGAALFGSMRPKELRAVRIDWHQRTAADMPLPPELSSAPVRQVSYSPDAKFGNYLGGLVNRFGGRASRPATAPQPPAPAADTAQAN